MSIVRSANAVSYTALDDGDLVDRVKAGEAEAFRAIMKRHNRLLYRVARGVLGNDSEAEDVTQDAFVRAFQSLDSFRGESALATWLTRIALNEALGRRRRQRTMVDLGQLDRFDEQGEARVIAFPGVRSDSNPEAEAFRSEIRRLLEHAVDALPEPFRIVFVMREIEEMGIEETAAQLDLRPETVKTRLHRARRLLRRSLQRKLGSAFQDTYAFDGLRCERTTEAVMRRLGIVAPS
jgi:RNA polymerase sigma-70 factor (ECF subfamily)